MTGHENLLINTNSPEGFFLRCGFLIRGNKNLLVGNQSTLVDEGFLISGDGNALVGNIVTRSGSGIVVSGQKNVIVRNTAQDNGTDLVDTHEDCDGNLWQRNVFRTGQAGFIETPACIR